MVGEVVGAGDGFLFGHGGDMGAEIEFAVAEE